MNTNVTGYASRWSSPPGGRSAGVALAALVCIALSPGAASAARLYTPVQDSSFGNNSPAFIAIRWLWLLSVVGVIGAVVFRALVLDRAAELDQESRREAAARSAHMGLVSASFALAAAGLKLMAQSVALMGDIGPDTLVLVTGTSWGTAWWVYTSAAALALIAFGLASRAMRSGWWLAGLACLGLAAGSALTGHAAAARFQPVPMLADTIHVVAAGGWIGGLLAVLAAGIPAALAGGPGSARRAAALINAFSPVALACAGCLVATGVFASWVHIGSFHALIETPYGRLLSLKVFAFLAVAGFGAVNFIRLKPRLTSTAAVNTLRRSATSEITLGAVVLLVTAILVATSPPAESVDMAVRSSSSCVQADARTGHERGIACRADAAQPAAD